MKHEATEITLDLLPLGDEEIGKIKKKPLRQPLMLSLQDNQLQRDRLLQIDKETMRDNMVNSHMTSVKVSERLHSQLSS